MPGQPNILDSLPSHALYLHWGLKPGVRANDALAAAGRAWQSFMVMGVGRSLVAAVNAKHAFLNHLPAFPVISRYGVDVPSTPSALWCWVSGEDRGQLVHRCREISQQLGEHFELLSRTDAFKFGSGLDLSGYEDGTENPEGEKAAQAALCDGSGLPAGSSLVAVQKWQHNMSTIDSLGKNRMDDVIGRSHETNEELEDAPESAHVKRAEQEAFDPPAFMVRRSMPWADGRGEGLVFVSFVASVSSFERILTRMTGGDDAIVDGLFSISRPLSGSYYWCPPVKDGRLDLNGLS